MPKFEIYKDTQGYFRWRLKASNGQIVAVSGEGFNSKQYAVISVDLIKAIAKDAHVIDLTVVAQAYR